jgi:hypothetical protein
MSLNSVPRVIIKTNLPPIALPSLGMTSWKLLHHLIVFWSHIENPLFLREINRPPVWFGLYERLARARGVALALGGMLCYTATVLVFFVNNLLILLLPILFFWTALTGLTLAPMIVTERERHTWDTLRTTPLDLETIVLGKTSGALWWQRDALRVMIGLLVLFALGIGLVSLILVPTSEEAETLPGSLMCGAALVIPVLIAGAFIADRAQHFALTVVSVLAISASARAGRVAFPLAVVVALLWWLLDIGIAGTLLAVQPERVTLTAETDWWILSALGPVAGYLSELTLDRMALYVGGTLAVREILVHLIWRWTIRLAARD